MRATSIILTLALACAGAVLAQTAAKGLVGDWEGALGSGGNRLRLVLHVTQTADGIYLGKIDSLDQGSEIPFDRATVTGSDVKIVWTVINATYTAKLSADGSKLEGKWSQAGNAPLVLTRKAAPPEAPKTAAAAASPAPNPLGAPVDVLCPTPPIPVEGGGGRSHLVYELRLTNFSGREITVTSIEALGDTGPLASWEGKPLIQILGRSDLKPDEDTRKVAARSFQTAWMWLTLDRGIKPPALLRHKITIDGQQVDVAVPVSTAKPILLGPPLAGGVWLAGNGPGNASEHRRALFPVGGTARDAQRFAIDWVKIEGSGTSKGDPKDNKSYFAYGSPVLAVADAVVAAVKDGIPENVPGIESRAVPITLETIGGNHVVLDFGNGRYAFYAHLQPGSPRVKVGDRVKRGQVLGLVGNSGNSTEPHLHFQVMDGASPLGSEGLPYLIDAWEGLGGQNPAMRQNALPLENARVRFATESRVP